MYIADEWWGRQIFMDVFTRSILSIGSAKNVIMIKAPSPDPNHRKIAHDLTPQLYWSNWFFLSLQFTETNKVFFTFKRNPKWSPTLLTLGKPFLGEFSLPRPIYQNRSLGAQRAPTSWLRPSRPLGAQVVWPTPFIGEHLTCIRWVSPPVTHCARALDEVKNVNDKKILGVRCRRKLIDLLVLVLECLSYSKIFNLRKVIFL